MTISPSPYPSLVAEKLVNVTVTTEWSTAGASHQRQLSSLFSQWGSTPSKPVPSATPTPPMKLNESVSSSRRAGGMTLVELMIALGIVGFVLLVCYSSSIGLQRGFGYSSAWTEARVNQERVLDSLALDLRNATTIDFTPSPPGHRHIDRPQPLQFVLSKHWGPLGDVQRSRGRPYACGESIKPTPQPLIQFRRR